MTALELAELLVVERYAEALAKAKLAAVDATPWTPHQQAEHRRVLADAGLIPRYHCLPCLRGEHGDMCMGQPCRCRCLSFLNGPFAGGDPTAPDNGDRWVA